MIEGLKIELKSAELVGHIKKRAEYHKTKAEWYAKQVGELHKGGVESSYNSNDPVRSLQASEKDHTEKSALFLFLAEHIVPNEVYRLTESDLSRLELVSRYY
jgi:hypothetical protein